MKQRISILGSTGSIGRQAFDVVRAMPDQFEIVGIAANSNTDSLNAQIAEFAPAMACIADESCAGALKSTGTTKLLSGLEGLNEIAAASSDIVLCSMVGSVGLAPILAAIDAGNTVALANKEPMVMAGRIVMDRARKKGVRVLPVDSEHSAIFQCLEGQRREDLRCIHLTASGGPFYRRPRAELANVAPEEAANHPNWDMGVKISCDSSTLMNKGLEVMEAMWLFDLPLDQIEVVIHPQSIVHSLVEFTDGAILAHLGLTNMKFPIQYALLWPGRAPEPFGRLDLTTMGALNFDKPDFSEFPCLRLALDAAQEGGTIPAILNGSNETAVAAFCARQIGFLDIPDIVAETIDRIPREDDADLDTVIEADARARRVAREIIEKGKVPH